MNGRLILVAMAAAALLSGVTQTASADQPLGAALIQIRPDPSQFFQAGSWELTGPLTDSGSYVRTFAQTAPPDRPPFSFGPVRETFLLTSSSGTLTVREEARVTEAGLVGEWQIASGTGAYADASGHGTASFDGPTLTLSLAGVISKVG